MALRTYLEFGGYILLLCLVIPIKIKESFPDLEEEFLKYVNKYNKSYTDEEIPLRKEAFKKSLEEIEKMNKDRVNSSALYGLTKFSDMLPKEFASHRLKLSFRNKIVSKHAQQFKFKRSIIPQKVDWREKNVLTKIRNQMACGACWAFSTVENIEAMHAIQFGSLRELSVQQLIDCAGFGNSGCNGGDVCSLLAWLQLMKVEVHTEAEYPLTYTAGKCKHGNFTRGVRISDYSCDSFIGNEDMLLQFLAEIGPVAVAVNAQTWQNYITGVIQFHCGGEPNELNHAVQIVGYDLTAVIPHYIVRNTWGLDFGDRGYLYVAIGRNMCGIVSEVAGLRVL